MHRKKTTNTEETVADLIVAMRFDIERGKLIANDFDDAQYLLDAGITIKDILKMDLERLKLMLLDGYQVGDLLGLVSKEKLVTGPAVPAMPKTEEVDAGRIMSFGSKHDNFRYWNMTLNEHTQEKLPFSAIDVFKMKEKNNEEDGERAAFRMNIFSAEVKSALPKLNAATKDVQPIHLVTDWYLVAHEHNCENKMTRVLFSPTRKEILSETYEMGFPLDELTKNGIEPCLTSATYYAELAFMNLLAKHNTSLQTLAFMDGMTKSKVLLLCDHQHKLELLLQSGVSFEQLGKVGMHRLEKVLNHVNVDNALRLISATDLLGLNMVKTNVVIHSLVGGKKQNPFVNLQEQVDSGLRCLAHPKF